MNIENYIKDSIDTKTKILNNYKIIETVQNIAAAIVQAYVNGKKVLIAGNGGSAAGAQDFAEKLVSKFYIDRPGLSALSLSCGTSVLTAIGNDYGFEKVFARQVQALADEGDIFTGISTSGNSKNIIAALEEAKKRNVITIGLTGEAKCRMDGLCDFIVHVPSVSTPNIQEAHIMLEHIISAEVEEALFGKGGY